MGIEVKGLGDWIRGILKMLECIWKENYFEPYLLFLARPDFVFRPGEPDLLFPVGPDVLFTLVRG